MAEWTELSIEFQRQMLNRIQGMLEENSSRQSQSFGPYIYKVPGELRKQKESAYNPRVVSIGPIHRMDNHVQAMQDVKLKYAADLFIRIAEEMDNFDPPLRHSEAVTLFASKLTDSEFVRLALEYYAEEVGNVTQLAVAVIVDGCFILELLFKSYFIRKGSEQTTDHSSRDPIYCSPLRLLDIRHDLLLLENQIPFFVLQELFELAMEFMASKFNCELLSQFILSFFGNVMNFEEPHGALLQTKRCEGTDYRHILHLLHSYYAPPYNPPLWGNNLGTPAKFTSSASDLRWTGVKFVPCTAEEPFNVKFNEGRGPFWLFGRPRFEIPPLCIYDETEPFLRNLIAFEQCCPSVPRHFTSYAFLMNTLISSPEDAQVLEKAGVLRNYLNAGEEPLNLFQNICNEVVLGEFYFTQQCAEAGMHSSNRWPRILATLKRDYFGNPWSGMAVVAAIILFGLTVMQTLYGTLSYYQKK